jgi:hypothetical protein
MFSQPYLYYYLAAILLTFGLQRTQQKYGMYNGFYPTIVQGVCTIALLVFIVLGFFFMPHWWYPLVFLAMAVAVSMIPIPSRILAPIAIVAAPVLCGLAYFSLFGVL